ncbi:hypothetical protein COCC4DRAFT_33563, partial [Bipolaris maydis ATCC 48331]
APEYHRQPESTRLTRHPSPNPEHSGSEVISIWAPITTGVGNAMNLLVNNAPTENDWTDLT